MQFVRVLQRRIGKILSILPEDWILFNGSELHPLFMWLDFEFSKAKLEFYDRSYSKDTLAFQRTRYSPRQCVLHIRLGSWLIRFAKGRARVD